VKPRACAPGKLLLFPVSLHKAQQKRLAACKIRCGELERLMNKIYGDNALGRLPEKRYESLFKTYGQEQETLKQ
jgi:hypothetical protein